MDDVGAEADNGDDKNTDDDVETIAAVQKTCPRYVMGQRNARATDWFRQSSLAALRFSGRMPSSLEVRARNRMPGPPSS